MQKLFLDSQECWPADWGHYGPFFVRLAWHCSGTWRITDGRGGCAGGRQRFEPERSWADNTNLDKARALLWPIKSKFGAGLSWGDLFTLAGTAAIKMMGGPITEYCAGRIDSPDGTESLDLGPSEEQRKYAPCAINGTCQRPLGSTTVGLIYLNPEGGHRHASRRQGRRRERSVLDFHGKWPCHQAAGVLGERSMTSRLLHLTLLRLTMGTGILSLNRHLNLGGAAFDERSHTAATPDSDGHYDVDPDPAKSAKDIRDAFGRMGMNDSQTVALIGGGHTFGKSHGACPEGPGPAPNQDVHNPWPGKCGTGKGYLGIRWGMEGPWTTKPTEWDNEFFVDLLNRSWELIKGPGGHWQWQVKNAVEAEKKLMRLTSDMALIHDDIYQALVQEFALNMPAYERAFDEAWFKLTTNGGRWSQEKKCIKGEDFPVPQRSTPRMRYDDPITV
ncbi:unnamed protein product [Durusdinium trenchii]|uniref:Plant heme peroxidase family profile domain-containing protein n=1 Tax=Durusdinium trenchii TaxID=1381693 RepID=A0ABP0MD92_9DINO